MFIQNNISKIKSKLGARTIAPLVERIHALESVESSIDLGDIVSIEFLQNEDSTRSAINATLSQTLKSVVGGEGESCERGRGERLRNLSPLSLSQSGIISGEATHQNEMNNCNEAAEQFKKSESEAERKIESNGLPQNLATSRNDGNAKSLRESETSEVIHNVESKSVESKFIDCHDRLLQPSGFAMTESRNDKLAEFSGFPRSIADSRNDKQGLDSFNKEQNLDSNNDKNAESLKYPKPSEISHFIQNLQDSTAEAIPNPQILESINKLMHDLKPWRKGPFSIFGNLIDSEWNSAIKFNLIKNHLNIKGKSVADIGCNNGYYMFRMLDLEPKSITGFDPSALCKCQFDFINHFVRSEIKFELLGIEDLPIYDKKFDFIVCLGVLYHRLSPIESLKILRDSLLPNGELLLDTLIIDTEQDIALSPARYAKMKNVYFIPSISVLKIWLCRAGFKNIDILATLKTTSSEQRKTEWIDSQSLEDFLDSEDSSKTIEGYPAPIRVYVKAS